MTSAPIILRLAISTLVENPTRSILTLTGMVFGTAAVIATLSSNEGAQKYIAKQLQDLGTKIITITTLRDPITERDVSVIKKYLPAAAIAVRESSMGNLVVKHRSQTLTINAQGVDHGYFSALGYKLREGRMFVPGEYAEGDLTAILGEKARESLFGNNRPFIGERIVAQVGNLTTSLVVIGTLAEKGGPSGAAGDNSIFLTMKSAHKLFAAPPLPRLIIEVANQNQSTQVKRSAEAILSTKFKDQLQVVDAREAIERTQEIWSKQNLVGICLACISLLTGGVGIMNIMLLSIFQRQKEIGLRKAVGAKNSEIAAQFLCEAILVCLAGGICGILLGSAFGRQVASMLGNWEAEVSLRSVAIAIGFSILTGVLFGLLPAIRASRIDPYDALRAG